MKLMPGMYIILANKTNTQCSCLTQSLNISQQIQSRWQVLLSLLTQLRMNTKYKI